MSGHKRTTISVDIAQYRRMYDAAQKNAHMDQENDHILQSMRQETTQMLEQVVLQSQSKQQEFLLTIDHLNDHIREIEINQVDHVNRQAEEMNACLQQIQTNMQADFIDILQDREERISSFLAQEQGRRFEWESGVQEILHDQEKREHQKSCVAGDWIEAASTLADYIATNMEWQDVEPERFLRMDADLQTAIENFENQFPEAALAQAQQAYQELSQYRMEIHQAILRGQWLFATAHQQIQELSMKLEDARIVKAIDQKGEFLDVEVDVDHWSGGALGNINEKMQALIQRLGTFHEGSDIPDLEDITRAQLPDLFQQVDETVFKARLAVLQSQMRINIADIMLQALRQQGFVLQDYQYDRDDQRQGFNARVENLEGNQVIIEVNPSTGPNGNQEVHIHSLDAGQKTHHELRQRSIEISRSLRKFGLNVGALTTQPDQYTQEKNQSSGIQWKRRLWQTP